MSTLKKNALGNAAMVHKSDFKPKLNPPIMFVTHKRDDEKIPLTVEIVILKDLRKMEMKDNTKKKELLATETFPSSGATTIIMLNRLQTEIFDH
jgi:hypothetical protein